MFNNLENQLSFFVYGTLMPNHSNYEKIFNGYVIRKKAIEVKGFDLYIGKEFPYMVKTKHFENNIVHGWVLTVNPEYYEKILSELDKLEGFIDQGNANNHFERIIVNVLDEPVYTYIASDSILSEVKRELPIMPSGLWEDLTTRIAIHRENDSTKVVTNYADLWR